MTFVNDLHHRHYSVSGIKQKHLSARVRLEVQLITYEDAMLS